MLNMTEKEMKKLNTIKKIIGGECTKKEAVETLGITIRQINRLIIKYKNDGSLNGIPISIMLTPFLSRARITSAVPSRLGQPAQK